MCEQCVRCNEAPATMTVPADLCKPCWNVWWKDDPKNDPYWDELGRKSKGGNDDDG